MVRLVIGAALAYAAFRIGRELMDSVPDIERGPNAADFPEDKPKRRPAKTAARPRRRRTPPPQGEQA